MKAKAIKIKAITEDEIKLALIDVIQICNMCLMLEVNWQDQKDEKLRSIQRKILENYRILCNHPINKFYG